MYLLFRINAGKLNHDGNQPGGEESVHRVFKLLVLIFLKIPQNPFVKLLHGKGGLQIQLQVSMCLCLSIFQRLCSRPCFLCLLFLLLSQLLRSGLVVAAGAENQRTAHAEMGKKHLTKAAVNFFFFYI